MPLPGRHKWIVVGLMVAVIVLSGAGVWWWVASHTTPDQPKVIKAGVEMTGNLACLPKQGSGPQTLECAYGLRVGDSYYSLDMTNLPDQNLFGYTFDDTLK